MYATAMRQAAGDRSWKNPRGSACVHCRQHKLKCDAETTFPAPCTRCMKRGLSCNVNPSFKRISKQQRLDSLEEEVRKLKESVPGASVTSQPTPPSIASERQETTLNSIRPASPALFLAEDFSTDTAALYASRSIEGIEIDYSACLALLEIFYAQYYPHLPILPDVRKVLQCYDLCPLLFWACISIASKDSKEYGHLYPALVEPVQRLANDIHSASSKSVPFIQALLLLSSWPFPFKAQIEDRSWSYCTTAAQLALELGLHRPYNTSDFIYNAAVDEETIQIRTRTWLACYIVNHNVTTDRGVPSAIKSDDVATTTLKDLDSYLPRSLHHQVLISCLSEKVFRILCNPDAKHSNSTESCHPIIRVLENDFNSLEAQISKSWSWSTEITFHTSKLMLYSFAFTHDRIDESSEFTALVHSLCMRIIWKTCSSTENVPFWTAKLLSCVIYTVFFLAKIIEQQEELSTEKLAAKNSLREAYAVLKNRSILPEDHLARVCDIIEYLTADHAPGWKQGAGPVIRSRMAANIVYEAVWRAKERFRNGPIYSTQVEATTGGVNNSLDVSSGGNITSGTMDPSTMHWSSLFEDTFF